MPNVHGIEFNANQAELVKDLVRELLRDGSCAVYALSNMKPNGELRMATTAPGPNSRKSGAVFVRVRPGAKEATVVRPMNAKTGEKETRLTKIDQAEIVERVRIWRKETNSMPASNQAAA